MMRPTWLLLVPFALLGSGQRILADELKERIIWKAHPERRWKHCVQPRRQDPGLDL